MAKKKVFIDFDDVLFDTATFKDELFNIFHKIGISEEVIQQKYIEAGARKAEFTPDRMVGLIATATWNDPKMAEEEKEKLDAEVAGLIIRLNDPKYHIGGAKEFLLGFDRDLYELIILTYGDPGFQKLKINISGLGKPLVDEVIPTSSTKEQEIAKHVDEDEVFVLIDDKTGTLDSVKAAFPNAELYESVYKFLNGERYIKKPDEETSLPIS